MPKNSLQHIKNNFLAVVVTIALLLCLPIEIAETRGFIYLFRLSCILSIFLIWRSPSSWLKNWATDHQEESAVIASRRKWMTWALSGLGLLIFILTILEWRVPYFFASEDNYTQFLPIILQAGKSLFENGQLATWNGFQAMGFPTASLGYYGLLYPPMYISYAVAHYGFGNDFTTLSIFAWSHLIGGYALFLLALRHAGLRPSLATAGAIAFILMGYTIGMSQTWHYAASAAFWVPALVLSLILFIKRPVDQPMSWRWTLGTAIAMASFFYAGHAQLWFYSLMFWGLGIVWVWLCNGKPVLKNLTGRIVPPVIAMLLGLAFAAPLLIVQIMEVLNFARPDFDLMVVVELDSLLTLFHEEDLIYPADYFDMVQSKYFYGGIFAILLFYRAAILLAATVRAGFRALLNPYACFIFFAFYTLAIMLSEYNILWFIVEDTSPFSMFRATAKLLPFFMAFTILAGGQYLEIMIRKVKLHRFAAPTIAVLTMIVLATSALMNARSFMYVPYPDREYPEMDGIQTELQADKFTTTGRTWPAFMLSTPASALSLTRNYPTFYNIPTLSNYDYGYVEFFLAQAVDLRDAMKNDFMKAMHEYGVEWAVLSTEPDEETAIEKATETLGKQCYPEYDMDEVIGLRVTGPATKPMSYIQGDAGAALPYRITANGVDIDTITVTSSPDKTLISNFLYRRWMNAYTEGGQRLSVARDEYGRIAVTLPETPAGIVSIRYQPPWHYGLKIAFGALILTFCGIVISALIRSTKRVS